MHSTHRQVHTATTAATRRAHPAQSLIPASARARTQPQGHTGQAAPLADAADDATPAAFAARYEQHYVAVYRYCYLRLGQREAAEDAASETFLRALRALPDYRGGSFAGWLLRIAQRVCADSWRAHYRQPRTTSTDAHPHDATPPDAADPAATPEEQAVTADDIARLRAALQHLTPLQRDLLELQLAGLTTAEIADAMQRSPGAVRILRLRAQLHLRRILVLPAADGADAAEPPPTSSTAPEAEPGAR